MKDKDYQFKISAWSLWGSVNLLGGLLMAGLNWGILLPMLLGGMFFAFGLVFCAIDMRMAKPCIICGNKASKVHPSIGKPVCEICWEKVNQGIP